MYYVMLHQGKKIQKLFANRVASTYPNTPKGIMILENRLVKMDFPRQGPLYYITSEELTIIISFEGTSLRLCINI